MAQIVRKRSDKFAECAVDREQGLRSNRSTTENLWQQIARYVHPREATFTEEVVPGVERNRYILDSTAPRSLELFASFLHTMMNNPASRWINLRPNNEGPERLSIAMKQWKEKAENKMLAEIGSEASGYYTAAHQLYLDLGAFGTGPMYVDMVKGRLGVRHYHLADVVIDEDTYGNVDTVLRQFNQTHRQAKQRWGEQDYGSSMGQKDQRGREKPTRFLHVVFPTTDEYMMEHLPARDRRRVALFPFASAWVNAADRLTVDVGGFEEFPYMVPRWYKTRGEIYGRAPSMTVLPDIRMVNRMMETILRGAEKLVDPPLVVRDGGLVTPVRLFPGAVTFTDGEVKIETLIPPGASRIEYGDALLKMRQEAIRDGFFVPLFTTPESPVKTATQVLQETGERDRAVSPMLIRTHGELHNPFARRTYGLLSRAGMIEPPPEPIETLGVEFVSPLTASQKQNEALGTLRIIESLTPWGQIDPNVFDQFDPDEVGRIVHAGSGAPASILLSQTKIDQKRKARADAQQAQNLAATLIPAVEAGAKVTTANAAMKKASR